MEKRIRMKQLPGRKAILRLLSILAIFAGITTASAQSCVKGKYDFKVDGYSVTFEATTSGPVVLTSWYLNNQIIGKGDRFKYTFRDTGTYEVCLLILGYDSVNNQKCHFKYCDTVTIKDTCHLRTEFGYKIDGNKVLFEAYSNSTSVKYHWRFSDQNTGMYGKVIKREFKDGTYKVCVIAKDTISGCVAEFCRTITINNCNLTAGFDFETDGKKVIYEGRSNSNNAIYTWSFGDSHEARGRIQRYTYDRFGRYEVCLTVLDTVTKCKVKVCKIVELDSCNLEANFGFRVDSNLVVFEGGSNSRNVVYKWLFGDGHDGRGRLIKHEYGKPGTYEVCLLALDTVTKCHVKICKKVIIDDDSCNLEASFGFRVDSNLVVFEGGSNSRNVVYKWLFGDGHDGRGRIIKHEYGKPGTYEVCLLALDTMTKCHVKICKKVIIDDDSCNLEAKFGFRADSNLVVFEAGANSRNVVYKWLFGDGHDGRGRVIKHEYAKTGKYEVCLIAIDTVTKCHVKICRLVVLEDDSCDLRATFSFRTDGNNVYFEANSNVRDAKYIWHFGDGHDGTGRLIKHEYKRGSYKVCLTVISPDGKCRTTVCKEVEVDPCDLHGDFTFKGERNRFVFYAKSNDKNAVYIWSYGDGSVSSGARSKHQYRKPGVYNVCLTIISRTNHCKITICKRIEVKDRCDIIADFRYTGDNLNYKFEANTNKRSVIYLWDFGDGNRSWGKYVNHQYSQSGTYKVCVTVIDLKTRCRTTTCKLVYVEKKCKLEANFRYEIDQDGELLVAAFANQGNVKVHWDFGDGHEGRGLKTWHKYAKSGVYKVCMTVVSSDGCRVKVCKEIVVRIKQQQLADDSDTDDRNDDVRANTDVTVKSELEEQWNITLSPNPVQSAASIQLTGASGSKVEVINMLGVVVQSETMDGTEVRLDLSQLERGYYFIRVTNDTNDVKQIKFLKD